MTRGGCICTSPSDFRSRLSAMTGDLRPSRVRPRRQGRHRDEPRAVGQIGPRAFLMPSAPTDCIQSREAHPTPDVGPARGFSLVPSPANQLEPPVTAILNPQLKNGTTAQQAPAAPV